MNREIYIHPCYGEEKNGFGLSVFPVCEYDEEQLPASYSLEYEIETKLICNSGIESNSIQKWNRSLSRIPVEYLNDKSDFSAFVEPLCF